MGRTVAIVNQKGGVGKTTVTLGLASAALAAGDRVLVVDLDPQASSTWVLGHDPAQTEVTTAEVLTRRPAADALAASAWGDEVDLLPACERLLGLEAANNPGRLRDALAELVDLLRETEGTVYDTILLDCPPALGNLTVNGLTAADHAVIVVEPSALGLRGIGAVADIVDEVWDRLNPGLDLAGVVVNKVPAVSAEAERRYDELARIVGRKAIWQPVIPQRVVVNQAIGARRPIHSYGSRAHDVSAAFDALWARVRRITR